MFVMRMYLKRVTLFIVGALATVLILLMQLSTTSYGSNGNQSVNQRIEPHVSLIKPFNEKNDVNKFQLDIENSPYLTDNKLLNGRRKLNVQPLSHEELPPVVVRDDQKYLKKNLDNNNNVDSLVVKSDTKDDDDDVFSKYLGSVKTVKDPDIVSLSRIPLDTFQVDNWCTNASTLGTFWFQKYRYRCL